VYQSEFMDGRLISILFQYYMVLSPLGPHYMLNFYDLQYILVIAYDILCH